MQGRLTSVGKFLLAGLAQHCCMNSQPPFSPTQRFHPRNLTAGTIVRGAQVALLAVGGWAMCRYVSGSITDEQATRVALALGIMVLIAAPAHRGVHLLGAVAVWLTTCEFLAASRTGDFALWRWAVALATLAVIMILTRLPQFRAAARVNPWRQLGDGIRPYHATAATVAFAGRARWIAASVNRAR